MTTDSRNVHGTFREVTEKTIIVLAILLVLAFTFATTLAQIQTQPEPMVVLSGAFQSPSSVASAFDADLNNRNSTAALLLFADEATVSDLSNIASCSPCGSAVVYVGTTQIRGWLDQLINVNVQVNESQTFHLYGNNVSWTVGISVDDYRRLGVAPLEANVNATVENGKFSWLSIELTIESTRELSVASAANRAPPYSGMARGVAFGIIFLGLVFPAVGVYYVSRVKRLFATVPHLDKPWVLLGGGLGVLFVSVLLLSLRDVTGISAGIVDSIFSITLTICAFLVMSSMILMKRVMLGESDE